MKKRTKKEESIYHEGHTNGMSDGYRKGFAEATHEMEGKLKSLLQSERQAEVEVLKSIGQITESAARALMSFNKNL